MLRITLIAVAMTFAAPALAGPLAVTDDPYKAFARAEIASDIPAQSGWNYCHTGGKLSLWALAPRDGSAPILGVTVVLNTLRSPGEAYVELLGGLQLTELTRDSANFDCSNGCHNDFVVAYALPAETITAISGKTSVPLRISIRGEPKCAVEREVPSPDVAELQAWAAARH